MLLKAVMVHSREYISFRERMSPAESILMFSIFLEFPTGAVVMNQVVMTVSARYAIKCRFFGNWVVPRIYFVPANSRGVFFIFIGGLLWLILMN